MMQMGDIRAVRAGLLLWFPSRFTAVSLRLFKINPSLFMLQSKIVFTATQNLTPTQATAAGRTPVEQEETLSHLDTKLFCSSTGWKHSFSFKIDMTFSLKLRAKSTTDTHTSLECAVVVVVVRPCAVI